MIIRTHFPFFQLHIELWHTNRSCGETFTHGGCVFLLPSQDFSLKKYNKIPRHVLEHMADVEQHVAAENPTVLPSR